MFLISDYFTSVIFCIITMICWGSWANTQKLSKKALSFQLFYWDYTLGVLLLACLAAMTLGSFGQAGRSFLPDLLQADGKSYWLALAGGVVFNLANILLVTAIDIAGMAVAFPVAIGIALVLGVIVNYLALPVGNGLLLSLGVLSVALAIILDALAYKKLQTGKNNQLVKGFLIALVSGVLMGSFYRFVGASMSTHFLVPETGLFTPYSAMVIFSVGIFLSNILFNTYFMWHPLSGNKTTYQEYFQVGLTSHLIGMLGGMIWAVGSLMNFIAAGVAGFAISYGLGQGATLVAALWGVFVWREFKEASVQVNRLLKAMFFFYGIGLILIILAKLF